MLVIGPSLPVLRYLWSFSRSEATSAKALAVPLPKVCYDPSPLVHMALWSSAQMPMHWALGHLGTTPATRVRIDTSWLCPSSP